MDEAHTTCSVLITPGSRACGSWSSTQDSSVTEDLRLTISSARHMLLDRRSYWSPKEPTSDKQPTAFRRTPRAMGSQRSTGRGGPLSSFQGFCFDLLVQACLLAKYPIPVTTRYRSRHCIHSFPHALPHRDLRLRSWSYCNYNMSRPRSSSFSIIAIPC